MDVKTLLLLFTFCLPLRHISLTSSFGNRVHPLTGKLGFHSGVDLSAHADTVFAIADGVIKKVGYDRRLGRYIKIAHGSFESTYGHLSVIGVGTGDTVQVNQPIAITGSTGQVTGEHLHFAITYGHHSIDPLAFLCGWEQFQLFQQQQDHEKNHESTDR